mmetsp:Transcript_6151/g.14255  ORF Transcript_6151/g.14255 Transcript_6151/m.14255 type:complete len:130 (-) Transcript_6151:1702-2091(-)
MILVPIDDAMWLCTTLGLGLRIVPIPGQHRQNPETNKRGRPEGMNDTTRHEPIFLLAIPNLAASNNSSSLLDSANLEHWQLVYDKMILGIDKIIMTKAGKQESSIHSPIIPHGTSLDLLLLYQTTCNPI